MQSKPAKIHWIDLAVRGGEMGREDCQDGWQSFVGDLMFGTILDVGAGLGLSRTRLRNHVTLQDPSPETPVDIHTPVSEIESKSFDMVTAFDVIEHVAEDIDFLDDLCRIARKTVFITTPNELVSHAGNGCHCREYTPTEFLSLFGCAGKEGCWFSTGNLFAGDSRGLHPIRLRDGEMFDHRYSHQAALIAVDSYNAWRSGSK